MTNMIVRDGNRIMAIVDPEIFRIEIFDDMGFRIAEIEDSEIQLMDELLVLDGYVGIRRGKLVYALLHPSIAGFIINAGCCK